MSQLALVALPAIALQKMRADFRLRGRWGTILDPFSASLLASFRRLGTLALAPSVLVVRKRTRFTTFARRLKVVKPAT